MRVKCKVVEDTDENDNGVEVECTIVTCLRCDHVTQSFGTSEASVKRCLALMREECPGDEENFYVSEDD
jgi:hypothetical protein